MPYDKPDATDPMTLHGVVIETGSDGPMREMAECFIEEFLRSGFDAERIVRLFKAQEYAGAFLAYQALGEEAICEILQEQMLLRNQHRPQAPPECSADAKINLPVLDS